MASTRNVAIMLDDLAERCIVAAEEVREIDDGSHAYLARSYLRSAEQYAREARGFHYLADRESEAEAEAEKKARGKK